MAVKSNLVNLDAMILREDFALADEDASLFEKVQTISLRDFTEGGLMGPNLRKPDFQRETNHWTPEQIASLLECYVNGDLIPSVILWQSPARVKLVVASVMQRGAVFLPPREWRRPRRVRG